jgi:ammonia channel protein AmtB
MSYSFIYYCASVSRLGGSLLWFGWFGFNGSTGLRADSIAALAVSNTQLAAAFAFFVFIVLDWIVKGQPTVVCFLCKFYIACASCLFRLFSNEFHEFYIIS